MAVSLKERFLDAMIDGKIGCGLVVTREEFMAYFDKDNTNTKGCFHSNSEVKTGAVHSPTYDHFTQRIGDGTYRILPKALEIRLELRGEV
ncbi:hypothetical protein [Shewanella colwelliana]|uniref:hypothetical protein n=1 Tax=Shewanella colwelliana TaxID=23 RepID=UPI0022AEC66D|nr:hypothetical protein [Shewanella colwelliana]MCZ4337730.1 hypothetical protein [Shewanella colwelliana]